MERKTSYNRRLVKKRVLWLNDALCSALSFVVAESLVLSNRQLLVTAKTLQAILKRQPKNI